MNQQDFEHSIEKQFMKCKRMLNKKAEYYHSTGTDRLCQFKAAAKLQKISQQAALGGMMVKHTTKLYDIIDFGASEKEWNEVITDHIDYLFLLNAILEEE